MYFPPLSPPKSIPTFVVWWYKTPVKKTGSSSEIIFIRIEYLLLIIIKITPKVKRKILRHLTSHCIAQPDSFINGYLYIPVLLYVTGFRFDLFVCFFNKPQWRPERGESEIREYFNFNFSYFNCSRGYLYSSIEQQGHRSQGTNRDTEEGRTATANWARLRSISLSSGPIKSEHQEVWTVEGKNKTIINICFLC